MVTKAQARAFLCGGSRPTLIDRQFQKLFKFLGAEGLEPTLEGLADYAYDLITERAEDKLDGMARDQLEREKF